MLIREDFSFTHTQLGIATGLSLGAAAVGALLAGRIVERIGTQLSVYWSSGLVLLSVLGIASLTNSAVSLIALMATTGIGSGIATPSISSMLASDVPGTRHGTAFGLLTAAPQLAAFVGGLALPLVAEPWGWRATFAGAAVVTAMCVVVVPRRDREVRSVRTTHALPQSRRFLWITALAASLASASGFGGRFFLVAFAVSVGFSSGEAGFMLAATGFVAIFSRLGFGSLGDRNPRSALTWASSLMAVSAIGFIIMLNDIQLLVCTGALLAAGVGWGWNAPLSFAVVRRNQNATAQAIGFQMAGFFGGGAVGPLLVGQLSQQGGYTAAWLLCCGLAAAGATITLFARHTSPVA